MTSLREAAQQALEQLRCNTDNMEKGMSKSIQKLCAKENREAMDTLRAALAQQTQTPCDIAEDGVCEVIDCCRNSTQEEQEPTARYKCTVVDDQHPNGVPFEQWVNAPQEEPVAYTTGLIWRPRQSELVLKVTRSKQERYGFTVPLWTSPPRREWRGLKEWEINDGRDQLPTEDLCNWSFRQGVYFAEKALKERNA